jgi:hypothetical protein
MRSRTTLQSLLEIGFPDDEANKYDPDAPDAGAHFGDHPGDVDPDFQLGHTNFPHSQGYPNLKPEDKRFLKVAKLDYVLDLEDVDVNDPAIYPLFVSLYDISRVLGGHEEGGWWVDYQEHIASLPVAIPGELEAKARELFKLIGRADLDGKPVIYVEKEKGGADSSKRPPPHYE